MMRAGGQFARVAIAMTLLLSIPRVAAGQAPTITVWYRGTPAGIPRQDDLAFIRSLGFTTVSWPATHSTTFPALQRFAETVGLQVVLDADNGSSQRDALLRQGDRVRIRVDRVRPANIPALAWRELARGTRVLTFDAGEPQGHGLVGTNGQEQAWVRPAVGFTRQVSVNAPLLEGLQPGPAVSVERGDGPDITVSLFAAPRTWVLIAANAGRDARDVEARFPSPVPYALWTSLLDGSTMSMLSDPAGPRWRIQLAGGAAAVYFADR